MRIISQNKLIDVNYDTVNLKVIDRTYGTSYCATKRISIMADGYILGDYKSTDRAKEIMKEIGKTYTLNKICEIQTTMTSEVRELTYTPFFEMPEE